MTSWTTLLASATVLIGVAWSPAPASAQGLIATSRFYKTVSPGGRVKMSWYVSVDPGCRSLGETRVNLVRPPENGVVETARGSEYPNFAATNPRSACNRRREPATEVFYHAGPSFTGVDTFDVEAVSPDGTAKKYRYAVVVH